MDELNKLIAIKSIFELGRCYGSITPLLSNITDRNLSQKILNEFRRKNMGNIISIIDQYLYDNFENTLCYKLKDIKQFDFDYLENSNLSHIKKVLNISQLNLNTLKTAEGEKTHLFRHWDNLNRYAIIIEKNLVQEIKNNSNLDLNLTKEVVLAKLGYYTKLTIEKYDPTKSKFLQENINGNYERTTYEDYNGSYAQDYAGYSDQIIDDVFDGDPDMYWNID